MKATTFKATMTEVERPKLICENERYIRITTDYDMNGRSCRKNHVDGNMITKEYLKTNCRARSTKELRYISKMMRIHENFTSIENYQEIAIAGRAYKSHRLEVVWFSYSYAANSGRCLKLETHWRAISWRFCEDGSGAGTLVRLRESRSWRPTWNRRGRDNPRDGSRGHPHRTEANCTFWGEKKWAQVVI